MKIARVIDEMGMAVYATQEADGTLHRLQGDPFSGSSLQTGEPVRVQSWLQPVPPVAILCIGLNYRKHAEESGKGLPEYPVLFMKNLSAAAAHEQPILIPKVCGDEVDYEAELAVVIGRMAHDVPQASALDYVLGYTAANDVSARIWQSKRGGSQWVRGKSFDTFAPMGPVLLTPDEMPDPNDLAIRSELNGEVMQSSNTGDMIFDVATLISFLSQDTTLVPGTVILTGTPAGVGWARDPKVTLKAGDTVSVEIEGIGRLTNPVAAA